MATERSDVVQIVHPDGSHGTGFLVAPDKLVTALHVVTNVDAPERVVLAGKYFSEALDYWLEQELTFDPEIDPYDAAADFVVLTAARVASPAIESRSVLRRCSTCIGRASRSSARRPASIREGSRAAR